MFSETLREKNLLWSSPLFFPLHWIEHSFIIILCVLCYMCNIGRHKGLSRHDKSSSCIQFAYFFSLSLALSLSQLLNYRPNIYISYRTNDEMMVGDDNTWYYFDLTAAMYTLFKLACKVVVAFGWFGWMIVRKEIMMMMTMTMVVMEHKYTYKTYVGINILPKSVIVCIPI